MTIDSDDAGRLAALHELSILDTDPESIFDDAVAMAAAICATPIAAISLIDADRQWFKAEIGMGLREIPRNGTFCEQTIAHPWQQTLIPDTTADRRFADSRYVNGEPHVRFYAGEPLVVGDGHPVGTLCVMDTVARGLSSVQQAALSALARQVTALLEARRSVVGLADAVRAQSVAADRAESANDQLRSLFDGVPVGLVVTRNDGTIRSANPVLARLLQDRTGALAGTRYLDHVDADDQRAEADVTRRLLSGESTVVVREVRLIRADGGTELVVAASSLVGATATSRPVILTQIDAIGDRRQAEIELRESQSAVDGIVTVDGSECIVSWNEGAERLLGHPRLGALGKDLSLIVPPSAHQAHSLGFTRLQNGGEPHLLGTTVELEALHASGRLIPIELSLSRWYRGSEVYYTAVLRDITERRNAEAERRWRDRHDPVSGLGNLAALREEFAATCTDAGGVRGLLSLDLAGLTDTAAALGPDRTEELLGQIGDTLRAGFEPADRVFHLGGAHFVALLRTDTDTTTARSLPTAAQRMLDLAAGPFTVRDIELELDARVGAVTADAGCTGLEEMLRRAEEVRDQSPRRLNLATDLPVDEGSALALRDLALLGSLREAIADGQLRVHYQPLMPNPGAPATGRGRREPGAPPAAVEALVRWQHPQQGLLGPGQFIPQAEAGPLISPVTEWVLYEALRQRQRWAADGLDVRVSVNLSPRVLLNDDVDGLVTAALERTGCPPDRLMLEITESAIVADPAAAADVLSALRSRGIGIALDDFGTGFTSLSLIRTLQLDEIKLDRTFVSSITTNPADAAIASAVTDLAHRLGAHTVAEGVEDEATGRLLRRLGYDYLQGYHFSRPLPAEQAGAWLREHPVGRRAGGQAQAQADGSK